MTASVPPCRTPARRRRATSRSARLLAAFDRFLDRIAAQEPDAPHGPERPGRAAADRGSARATGPGLLFLSE